MKIALFSIVGILISGAIFYEFYTGPENIEAASTGFNASSQGLLGWDYSFAEHTFEKSGDAYRAVLIDSGRKVLVGRLTAEIVLCLALGLGVPYGGWRLLSALRNQPGEQVVPPNA